VRRQGGKIALTKLVHHPLVRKLILVSQRLVVNFKKGVKKSYPFSFLYPTY
jgi:hypothetical protein